MITNEMKAKIATLYWGCPNQYKRKGQIVTGEVGGITIQNILKGDYCKLILKPLSEITDEDANTFWKKLGLNDDYGNNEAYPKESRKQFILDWLERKPKFPAHYEKFNAVKSILAIDTLRELGYALPYMGIDLFESGIAIPNNKNL